MLPEKRAESRVTKVIAKPDVKSQDFGKIILPSENLAIAQKIIQAASPRTKSKLLEVSTGMLVKGRQKRGRRTTTKNNDKNESLSNIFERIILGLYYILIKKHKLKTYSTMLISLFFT